MNRYRFIWRITLVVLLLGGSGVRGDTSAALAQAPSIEDVVKAVVRISGQRCEPVCREAGVGSGAIVHPSGVILTAYHVLLDPESSSAQFLNDYIIEMSEDVRRPAVPRYRAHIIAVQPELDLALLRIYKTVNGEQNFLPFALTGLPVLGLGSTAGLVLQDHLTIVGYPYLAGSSIKVASFPLTGFAPQQLSGVEIPDANLTIQGGLSEGYSGGPVVAEKDGVYRIVGVITGGLGLRAEIGVLRSIDLLHDLQWLEPQARVDIRSAKLEFVQSTSGEPAIRINVDLDTVDLVGRRARLIFYAFADDILGMPVYAPAGTNRTRVGQFALAAEFDVKQFIDRIDAFQLQIPISASSLVAENVKFRILLWDPEAERVLWRSDDWYRPQSSDSAWLGKPITEGTPSVTPNFEELLATAIAATMTARTQLDTSPVSLPTLISGPTITPTPTSTATVPPKPMFTVQQPTVNVRKGPGTVWPVIGQLRQGEKFEILGRNPAGDWWQFTYNGQLAWVIGSLVTANVVPGAIAVVEVPPLPPTNTPIPTPASASTRVSPKDGAAMVYVPAGAFLMGSTDADTEASDDEKPQHKVYLDAFWIDRTEVTNGMFARFVTETGHKTAAEQQGQSWTLNRTTKRWERVNGADWQHPYGPDSNIQGLEQYSVVQISWDDAVAYCRWVGRRLPTEAEWEKAARGTTGRQFPWGSIGVAGNLLNFADRNLDMSGADTGVDDGYQFAAPVGAYLAGASPYGALDMAGNVWEWVADWYDGSYYRNSPDRNPQGPDSGDLRVLRGGSWSCPRRYVRAAVRLRHDSNIDIGFRCASSP